MNKLIGLFLNRWIKKHLNCTEKIVVHTIHINPDEENKTVRVTIDATVPYSIIEGLITQEKD